MFSMYFLRRGCWLAVGIGVSGRCSHFTTLADQDEYGQEGMTGDSVLQKINSPDA